MKHVHAAGDSNQPDIQIRCTSEWTDPAWEPEDKRLEREEAMPKVYLASNGCLYTFDEDKVTCPVCRKP